MKLTIIFFLLLTVGLQSQVMAGTVTDDSGKTYTIVGGGGLVDEEGNYFAPAGSKGVINSKTGEYIHVIDPWDDREKERWGDNQDDRDD